MVRIEAVRVDHGMARVIADLVNRAFSLESWFVDGDRISPDGVLRLADSGTGQFFVAYGADGTPVGCIYGEQREGGRGYFGLLSVDESQRGGGVGHQLLTHVEDDLRAKGCHTIEITVVDLRTELFPYYERRGYRVDGRTLPFPRVAKQPCVLVYMSRELTGAQ